MRNILIAALVVVAIGLVTRYAVPFFSAGTVDSPFAAYGPVSEEAALGIGSEVVSGIATRNGALIDQHFALDDFLTDSIHDLPLRSREREGIITGMRQELGTGIGTILVRQIPTGCTPRCLRVGERDGRMRVVVRLNFDGGAINYIEFYLGRDPQGADRIIDVYDHLGGQTMSMNIKGLLFTMLPSLRRTVFERAVAGDNQALENLPEIKKRLGVGDPAGAMAIIDGLPVEVRATRAIQLMRVVSAQQIDEATYVAAMAEMDGHFAADPTLALMRIDARILAKDFRGAVDCIRQAGDLIGGDAFLDALAAQVAVLGGFTDEARTFLAQARSAVVEDDKPTYMGILDAAIQVQDHGATAETLAILKDRFDQDFDLDHEVFATFAASAEGRALRAAP